MFSPQKIIFDNIFIFYTYFNKIGDFHIFIFSKVGRILHLLSVFFQILSKSLMTVVEEKKLGIKMGKKPLRDNIHKIRQNVYIVHQPIQC
ncbi:hypothetical protein BS1321_21260 [Peribacillus simplex NBRC 15720 = DSM 1321]|uniref:Uncharacterized protein n=1 Tax=Peribacillus simplex NBRC 15720 = DSM 1321 TaxID=1349754 RepID=A0A223ELU8_9BACI|nr:hypothetical protein BS1321_21260 [Peribacillus simplex NBRC 15720 = DSM 1321]